MYFFYKGGSGKMPIAAGYYNILQRHHQDNITVAPPLYPVIFLLSIMHAIFMFVDIVFVVSMHKK